jgi:hypothetical protein
MTTLLGYAGPTCTLRCGACGEPITTGQEIYTKITDTRPWLPEDHTDQEYSARHWHQACDQGSIAAECAIDQRRSTPPRGLMQ